MDGWVRESNSSKSVLYMYMEIRLTLDMQIESGVFIRFRMENN